MSSKKIRIAGVGVIAVLGVIALVLLLMRPADSVEKDFRAFSGKEFQARDIKVDVLANLKFESTGEGGLRPLGDLSFEQMVALLRKKYGAHINNGRVRIKMLNELIKYLKQKYPNNWVAMLHELLGTAFPDGARELFTLSEKLYKYEKRFEEMRKELMKLSAEERRAKTWELRYKIFGDEADSIWTSEKRSQSVAGALGKISQDATMSVPQKVEAYRESIREAYGDDAGAIMDTKRGEFANRFFRAVQTDLAEMPHAQRRETYREVWKGMGFDSATVGRLDKLEDKRDQRWSNGELYMAQRDDLAKKYSEPELSKKIDELRESLFGEEASVIKTEEEGGFYRFKRARRFGLN